MMANLVKIGNSQGIRIPKVLIEQAHLEGKELNLMVVEDGLLISPSRKPRDGWKEAFAALIATHDEQIDSEWLDASLTTDKVCYNE